MDGTINCSVERDAITKVEGVDYNLIKNRYVLLVAAGTTLRGKTNNNINYDESGGEEGGSGFVKTTT